MNNKNLTMSYLNFLPEELIITIFINIDTMQLHKLIILNDPIMDELSRILNKKIFWIRKLIHNKLAEYVSSFPLIINNDSYYISDYNFIEIINDNITTTIKTLKAYTFLSFSLFIKAENVNIHKLINKYSRETFKKITNISKGYSKNIIVTSINDKYYYRIVSYCGDLIEEGYLNEEEFKLLFVKSVLYDNPQKDIGRFITRR